MNINCPEIDCIVKLAEETGNSISEITLPRADVIEDYYMTEPLTGQLKEEIKSKFSGLEYWDYQGSPHYPADEGFLCKEHNVAITFPKMRQNPW